MNPNSEIKLAAAVNCNVRSFYQATHFISYISLMIFTWIDTYIYI